MKNKAPLALMEQLVMVLVFALAAAVCLQVFVMADRLSRSCQERDRAAMEVQNAAEMLKSHSGDLSACAVMAGCVDEQGRWQLFFDEAWQRSDEEHAVYRVTASPVETEHELLGGADVWAETAGQQELFRIGVSWQKVDADE